MKNRPHPPRLPHKTPAAPAKKPTHWDNVADWYDTLVGDEGSEYHQKIILPGVLRLIRDPDEKPATRSKPLGNHRVLDLACGQGVLCRQLAGEGAHVVGVDAAPALIEAARRRETAEPLGITYHVADVTKLSPLPPEIPAGTFDAVTILLAIQNIQTLSPVWRACREALKPAGRLIVVMMHPCFRVFRKSAWHWEDAPAAQSRLINEYLTSSKAEIQMRPGAASSGGPGETTTSFHRPLQAYVNTLGNSGLYIDHLDEWPSHRKPPVGPKFEALDKSRREIPLFLALRARPAPRI